MWAAWIMAAIGFAAAAFMLRFLIALLRESAPSICCWIVPLRREAQEEEHLKVLRGIYLDDDCRMAGSDCGRHGVDLLEKENYAKEECPSGLIALDARPVSGGLVWRSIRPGRGRAFREHGI
jgi:hypothetical protein